jgi:hypothetical protein
MKINSSYRLASVSSLFLLLAACGGSSGGGAPAPAPAPAPAAVPIATINGHIVASFTATDGSTNQGRTATAFAYAERVGDTPSTPVLSVSSSILNVSSSFSNTGGSTFGGVGIDIPLRDADRNQVQSGATKVQFSLASTGTNKTLKFKIKAVGAQPNGCVPSASVTVTATQTNYELALTEANFKLPDFCPGATASNPALAGTLANIGAIEVSDEAFPSTGSATVGIQLGSIAFAPVPATPATSAISITGPFSFEYGTGASGHALAESNSAYTLTGNRTSATESWAATVAVLPLTAESDVSGWPALSINLASTGNSQLVIMLQSGDAFDDGCFPSYVVTGLSGTAATRVIPFSSFSLANNPDAACATPSATRPDTALALTKLKQFQIRELKGSTGLDAVSVVIGKPVLLSGQ